MVRLPRSATPRHFADAVRETVTPLAERISGGDGRISKADAKRALTEGGLAEVARDALESIAAGGAVSVKSFVEDQVAAAAAAATEASGDDGRLSRKDAEKMPRDLRIAFHFIRNGEIPGVDDVSLASQIPASWRDALKDQEGNLAKMDKFLAGERKTKEIYPPQAEVFAALDHTPLDKVRVVLIGQDPYHGPGEAHGLSFSVPDGVKIPPSLRNMLKELESDTGGAKPASGNLTKWAEQGVLLLNTALTVEKDKPASHSKKGWEEITNAIIQKVDEGDQPVVFLLLGAHAQKLGKNLDATKHAIVKRAHPSPLSASRGFLGTKPFAEINDELTRLGRGPVDWKL